MTVSPFDRYAEFTDLSLLKEFSDRPLRRSIRVNTLKCSVEEFQAWAKEKDWKLEPVPWCPEGFFVDRPITEKVETSYERKTNGEAPPSPIRSFGGAGNREALGKDVRHLLGHFYMQEAASMLPVALLDPQPGNAVLDMSAAPGSKTTQIAARMSRDPSKAARGVILANDIQEKRLWTLKSALHRSGVTNAVVTKKVGQWFSRHMVERFDRVLCDAPCTAQGTARKDTDALRYCSTDNIAKMARLQVSLLSAAIDAAKVGGRIVYSTCTLTPEENEAVVLEILNKFIDQVRALSEEELGIGDLGLGKAIEDSMLVQKSFGKSSVLPFLRLWPQTYDTEGFFCAVLEKVAPTRAWERMDRVPWQEEEVTHARAKELLSFFEERYGATFFREGERLFQRGEALQLSTDDVASFMLPMQDYALGLPFAKLLDRRHEESKSGKRFRLDNDLTILRGGEATRNFHELSQEELMAMLSAKDIPGPEELNGHIVLRYRGIPIGLGLAKAGRIKNNLPRAVVQLRT